MKSNINLNSSRLNMSRAEANSNERMQRLGEKLSKITSTLESEKNTKYEQYEGKIISLYNSIEEIKDNNNKKFNDVKEQVLLIQKTSDDESQKRESAHHEFMEFMKKMEEKIFEKFDAELNAKREIEVKLSQYLEEKFNHVKSELQKESKTRYDAIENLEFYFEKELPKIQESFRGQQMEREEFDTTNIMRLNDEVQK